MGPRDFFVRLGVIHVCAKFRARRTNVAAGLLFKGRGQGVWPRPSTKFMSYVQAGTRHAHVKFLADANLYTKVNAKYVVFSGRGTSPRSNVAALRRTVTTFKM